MISSNHSHCGYSVIMRGLLVFFLICIQFVSSAQTSKWKHGNSVVQPGIHVYVTATQLRFIPFMDEETMKVGFLRNASDLNIAIEPIYDRAYISGYLLVPVKINGKWGVMDLAARYSVPDSRFDAPLIPCQYDEIEVINDNVVICDGKKIDITQLGYEAY